MYSLLRSINLVKAKRYDRRDFLFIFHQTSREQTSQMRLFNRGRIKMLHTCNITEHHSPIQTSTNKIYRLISKQPVTNPNNLQLISPHLNKPVIDEKRIIKVLKNDNQVITIATMSEDDLCYVMSNWSLQEGWYPTQYTVEPFHAASPNGYYLLFLGDEPIVSLSAVSYSKTKIAFLGLYIVIPEYRGKGYGKLLWEEVTSSLISKGFTLGLNAQASKVDFYRKSGFELAYYDEIWSYTKTEQVHGNKTIADNVILQPITESNIEDVIAYDTNIFKENRQHFLLPWIQKPETISIAAFLNNQLKGYGIMSARVSPKFDEEPGYRIGPLYADTPIITECLLNYFTNTTNKRPIVMDIPGNNVNNAVNVVNKIGFLKKMEMAHMYTKPQNNQNDDKNQCVYAKTSLAISPC